MDNGALLLVDRTALTFTMYLAMAMPNMMAQNMNSNSSRTRNIVCILAARHGLLVGMHRLVTTTCNAVEVYRKLSSHAIPQRASSTYSLQVEYDEQLYHHHNRQQGRVVYTKPKCMVALERFRVI